MLLIVCFLPPNIKLGELFHCVHYYFLNIFSSVQQHRNSTDNSERFGHYNRDMKCSSVTRRLYVVHYTKLTLNRQRRPRRERKRLEVELRCTYIRLQMGDIMLSEDQPASQPIKRPQSWYTSCAREVCQLPWEFWERMQINLKFANLLQNNFSQMAAAWANTTTDRFVRQTVWTTTQEMKPTLRALVSALPVSSDGLSNLNSADFQPIQ